MSDAFTSDTYNALCREAEGYLAGGLTEQARELLLKAVSLIGTRARARSLLADACMALGLWSEAREQLEQLTTLEIGSVPHHYRLGQVLEELGEFETARDNYEAVVDREPAHRGAATALGRLSVRQADQAANTVPAARTAPAAPPSRKPGSDFQVFPDQPASEDVFASGDDVESLLKDIGVSSEAEADSGVSELLSSVGIDLAAKTEAEEPKKEVRDISSLLGSEGGGGGFELESVFHGGQEKEEPGGPGQVEPGRVDLDTLFGIRPAEEARPAADESVETAREGEGGEPAGSGAGETAPAAEEENAGAAPEVASPAAGPLPVLESIFQSAPDELPEAAPAIPAGPVPAGVAPEAPPDDAGRSEDTRPVFLETVFGLPGLDGEAPPEPVVEEAPPEPVAPEAPPEPVVEEAPPEPVAPEAPPEPMAEEAPPEAVAPEMPPEPVAEEAPPEAVAPEMPPEPVAEEAQPEAAVQEVPPEPVAEEAQPEAVAPEMPPEPVAEEAQPEAVASEMPPEPVAEEAQPEAAVQEVPPEPVVEEAPPEAVVAAEAATGPGTDVRGAVEPAVFTLAPPSPEDLLRVDLSKGSLEVKLAFVVAHDASIRLVIDGQRRLVEGSGTIWLGQASRVPVVVDVEPGDLVRADRTALSDSLLDLVPAESRALPAMSRASSGGRTVIFTGGRHGVIETGGRDLSVRSASILYASNGLSMAVDEANPDFVRIRGDGRVLAAP